MRDHEADRPAAAPDEPAVPDFDTEPALPNFDLEEPDLPLRHTYYSHRNAAQIRVAESERALRIGADGVRRYSLGAYMENVRTSLGISMRQAARQSGISEGRWRQLESGYQSVGGERVKVKTTPETVLKVANGLNLDPDLALSLAGLREQKNVQVAASSVWPLPSSTTIRRDPDSHRMQMIRESHVTPQTMQRARAQLRKLERLCEEVTKLPTKDIEYLQHFIENFLAEVYHAEEEALRDQLEPWDESNDPEGYGEDGDENSESEDEVRPE